MESLLLHGGGGGGGPIACGSVESYGIYSVFYTCGLLLRVGLPCGPLLECVYLQRVLRIKKRTTRFCLFSEGIFSGRSNPMVFTFLCTPVDCSCALCIKSRKAWFLRCVGWFSGGVLSTRSFELRCPFFTSCVGELLCQCGVGGWGGVMCGTNKQGIAYCADLYSA